MSDTLFPGDIPSRGVKHAGFVGSLAGGPTADRTFAPFLLGPGVGLFLNIDFDQLPGHLVGQGPGDSFQLGELGAPRKAIRVKLSRQFPSDLAQAGVKFLPNRTSILSHLRRPLQVAGQLD
jgi:hypothetical protein